MFFLVDCFSLKLKKVIDLAVLMLLTGTVSSGLGRAHVFMSQQHYQEQFRGFLGHTAWPGTLNVAVEGDVLAKYIALRNKAGIDTLDADEEAMKSAMKINVSEIASTRIRGFLRDGVSFGGATAFNAKISHSDKMVNCAILIPDLTRHIDVIEVISGTFLREFFNIEDGAEVTIELI
jgi:riboflavin kinase|tara:strand:+ start:13 stop:543 length:531 start_codon:yes stop_codon:yes gene_type:complete